MSNRTYIKKLFFWLILFLFHIKNKLQKNSIHLSSHFCAYQYWHEASCAQMWPYSEWHWHRHGIDIDACMIKGSLHVMLLWIGGLGRHLSGLKKKQLSMKPFLFFFFPSLVFSPFKGIRWGWLSVGVSIDCGVIDSQLGWGDCGEKLKLISREKRSMPRNNILVEIM